MLTQTLTALTRLLALWPPAEAPATVEDVTHLLEEETVEVLQPISPIPMYATGPATFTPPHLDVEDELTEHISGGRLSELLRRHELERAAQA